jgi:hypothetical protein
VSCHVWWKGTNVLEEPVFPVSRVEEHGGSMFLNNIVTHLTGYMTLYPAENMTVITTSVLTKYMFACFES